MPARHRPDLGPLYDAVAKHIKETCPEGVYAVYLRIDVSRGPPVGLHVPPGWEPAGQEAADSLTECEEDILRTLETAGERMSGEQVKQALQRAELLHGDSTVNRALAELANRKGKLTNRRDSYGRGYGLAEWG